MDVLDLVKGSNSMQPDAGSSAQPIVRMMLLKSSGRMKEYRVAILQLQLLVYQKLQLKS